MFDLLQNKIKTEKDWLKQIQQIKDELKNPEYSGQIINEKQAIKLVKESVLTGFKKRIPNEKFGILFSGGIDSTLLAFLAKKENLDFTCYLSVLDYPDFSEPHDLIRATSAAKELDLDLKIIKTKLDELKKSLPQVIKVIKRNDPLHVGIAAALWPAIEQINQDNLKYFMTGLGADQIYAGGEKYRKTDDINKLIWKILVENVWPGDISRDTALAKYFNLKMLTPYYSKESIMTGMRVDNNLKYNKENNLQKYILRLAAIDLSLPKDLALRRSRPTQYGSKFDKGIERLTKKNGFKYKSEYLQSLIHVNNDTN